MLSSHALAITDLLRPRIFLLGLPKLLQQLSRLLLQGRGTVSDYFRIGRLLWYLGITMRGLQRIH